jgi:cytochrome b561
VIAFAIIGLYLDDMKEGPAYELLLGLHKASSVVVLMAAFRSPHPPSSGVIGSITGDYPIHVFGLFVIPAPESANETLSPLAFVVHGLFANLLMMALLIHVGGALKHHFKDKDATLSRMFGRRTVQR